MPLNTDNPADNLITDKGGELPGLHNRKIRLLTTLIAVVCLVVVVVHWPALSARALSFDDSQYLTDNLMVQNPSWTSASRFLTEVLEPSTVGGYYQPLSMISLMLDHAMGGRADHLLPFHRTSLALHVANTALIIILLYLLFGQPWIAAAAGLLFGVHPMTVEPIAWVGERKTLLAAFFALWCLILYVRFARKGSWKVYAGCTLMYVLALMSKPTSLPLPALMLVLDFWPLRRLNRKAVVEKIPLFALGVISAIITYISQTRTAEVLLPAQYGPLRIPLMLCHNIVFYLYKIVWPVNLSSHYAFPEPLALSQPMVLAGVVGTCILFVLLAVSLRWTRAAIAGWLFFFLAILPTMQIVGFSNVIASDKFAYLPSVGLLIVLVAFLGWVSQRISKLGAYRAVIAVYIVALLLFESVATRNYLAHWRDTKSLFENMLTLTPNAPSVHNMLGIALNAEGKQDLAIIHFNKALDTRPDDPSTHYNLGNVLSSKGSLPEAVEHYRKALNAKRQKPQVHNNLGYALESLGEPDQAIVHYKLALELEQTFPEAHYNLANTLRSQGNLVEAVLHYQAALKIDYEDPHAHYGLGVALALQEKFNDAINHFRAALEFKPDYVEAMSNLGVAVQTQDRLIEAINLYRQALQIDPDFADAHYNLAVALGLQGQLDQAFDHVRKALKLNPDDPDANNLINNIQKRIEASRQNQP